MSNSRATNPPRASQSFLELAQAWMAFLLDTNLLSELRRRDRCDPNVAEWQRSVNLGECYVSVIAMLEIATGIEKARKKDKAFGAVLEKWFEGHIRPAFDGRVIPVDSRVAHAGAPLLALRSRGLADALIAATAKVYRLTLATRNTPDFDDCGISLVNPWEHHRNN